MRRWWLVLGMVFVMLLASPSAPGNAAASLGSSVGEPIRYGPGYNFAYEWDASTPGTWIKCNIPMYWATNELEEWLVVDNAHCNLGWLTDNDQYVRVKGQGHSYDAPGAVCERVVNIASSEDRGVDGWTGATVGKRIDIGDSDGWGGGGTRYAASPGPMHCNLQTVCVEMSEENSFTEVNDLGCYGAPIGGPLPKVTSEPKSCTEIQDLRLILDGTTEEYRHPSDRDVLLELIRFKATAVLSNQDWRLYYFLDRLPGVTATPELYPFTMPDGRTVWYLNPQPTPTTGSPYSSVIKAPVSEYFFGTNPALPRVFKIVGVGLAKANGLGANMGYNRPAQCAFYFGERARAQVAGVEDDPGALDTDPPPSNGNPAPPDTTDPTAFPAPSETPPEGQCDFKVTDPSSWLTGGMCAAVGLLGALLKAMGGLVKAVGQLLAAVAGLVADLLGALLDLLMSLFVPSPGAWDFASLKNAFTTRPPGSLLADGGGLVTSVSQGWDGAGSGASCTGNVDGHEVNICPANGPNSVYMTLYNLVRLALLIGTGLYLFHILREAIDR